MNVKRAIVLVFLLRAAMLGAGCGGEADYGEPCNDHDNGACDRGATCKPGLYCAHEGGGTCDLCTGSTCPSSTPSSTSTSPPKPECTFVVQAAPACNDGERVLYCPPDAPFDDFGTFCRNIGSNAYYCCSPAPPCDTCDASTDAANDAGDGDASDTDTGVHVDN